MSLTLSRSPVVVIVILVLALAALGGMLWGNYRFANANPGGNDFLVHWVGTRSFLMEGMSPYSDAVAERIQTRAYGRPARPGEHELRVAYPLYSALIFSPFALVADYTWARALWMTTLEVAIITLAVLSLRITDWRPRLWMLGIFLLFALVWYHSVRPVINGNAVVLVALFLVLAFLAVRARREEAAGLLLALSTIKPNLALLVVLFVLIWAISHRRWTIILWFFGGLGVLVVVAALLIPDWILQNLREILRYPAYNPPGTLQDVLSLWIPAVGGRLGWAVTVILGLLLLWEWIEALRKDLRWFFWTASFTLVASQWIGIQTDPGNFIILLPALVLLFAVTVRRWGSAGRFLVVVMMLLLFVGIWWIFLATVSFGDQPQQHPVLFIPLPLFLLAGLYWVRWWAITPRTLWIDRIREREEVEA